MTSLERQPSQLASNCCPSVESAELTKHISHDMRKKQKPNVFFESNFTNDQNVAFEKTAIKDKDQKSK